MGGFFLIPPSGGGGVDQATLDAAVAAALADADVDGAVATAVAAQNIDSKVSTAVAAQAIDTKVQQAFENYTPGTWLAGAERTTNHASAVNGTISALTASVVGKGRPVRVEVFLPAVYNATTANNGIRLDIQQDGVQIQRGFAFSPSTTLGPSVRLTKKTATLTLGQTYVFGVNVFQLASGTMTVLGSTTGPTPMTIDVYAA